MTELFDMQGKVALLTGASAGMGFAMARLLGEAGARIIISSNDVSGGESAARALREQNGVEATHYVCDAGARDQIKELAQIALAAFGRVDVLVCNAGYAPPFGPLGELSDEEMNRTLSINLLGVKYLSDLLIPGMAERRDGSVVLMSSIAGLRGNRSLGFYGVTKAANAALARNLAVEWGASNVRVNAISPGVIDTGFAAPLTENVEAMQRRLALTPLRRVGTPDEVAGVVLLLASRAGAFITGQNIVVDGGTTVGDGN
ncbi:glucose 1-dehydrogenase [Paraburkholderia sp. J8-2]|uniref:SDR family NAD(P)-dependent oxidoreductase n=1 Tax=Paraburkholderia sp. J8-2 TaxID=2805440 RepID=UPI002AB73B77|nr:glucose 1-dehydrogenase [Paraburkholderia sp. J8-2]